MVDESMRLSTETLPHTGFSYATSATCEPFRNHGWSKAGFCAPAIGTVLHLKLNRSAAATTRVRFAPEAAL